MTLEDSVDLVLFAMKEGRSGDIYVQKAPSCYISDLAEATRSLLKPDSKIKIIGTRHGEKLYETLLTKEELAKAEDMGRYFRVPADNRELNYEQYFTQGQADEEREYNSHNTDILGVAEIRELLMRLSVVQDAMEGMGGAVQ